MIRQFYMLSPLLNNYESISFNNKHINSGLLYLLFLSFNKYIDWIAVEEKNNKIYLWDIFDEDDCDNWEDIQKLIISKKNYEHILKKWNIIVNDKPKYFILSYDDNSWINLVLKDELSQEDWQYIDQDKYEKLSKKTL